MSSKADELAASLAQLAPPVEDEAPAAEPRPNDEYEAILRAIEAHETPAPIVVETPPVDLTPLADALAGAAVDPVEIGKAVAAAVVAALESADPTRELRGAIEALEAAAKRVRGGGGGGGGGGATEVSLRAGDDRAPVSEDNPLPVSSNALTNTELRAEPVEITGSVTSTGASLSVSEALNITAHNLASAAYSGTTSISNDYQLDSLELHFTTRAKRTVTLTTEDGTIIYRKADDFSLDLDVPLGKKLFNAAEDVTLQVTQTGSACSMSGKLVVATGSLALEGNPTVNQGTAGAEAWLVDTGLDQPTRPSDTQPVSAVSLPLPSGAATSAKQDSQITELQDIEADVEALLARVGEVQASPTSNTVLDRLKSIATKLTDGTQVVSNTKPVQSRSISRFYNVRGQRYIATTDYVPLSLNTSNQLLAVFQNPSDSGVVVLFDKAEFAATTNTTFTRFGGGTVSLIGSPTAKPIGRTDGGTSTSTQKIYTGGNGTANARGTTVSAQFSVSAAGTVRKVAVMLAYEQYKLDDIDGRLALQPGQQSYWVVDEVPGGGSGTFNALIDFEWIEIPTATWTALVSAMQALAEY